jgi:hypothetical protein
VVIEDNGARPVNCGVGNQGAANLSSVIDRLDDVDRLVKVKVLGAVRTRATPPCLATAAPIAPLAYNR